MAKLFMQEVPEIYDGIVEIIAVARDPGSRAKIAVYTTDNSIDPVGACVGMRGSRVQSVVNELQGEKIDIVKWSPDVATFVISALAPAEATKVVLDEDLERIEVVVPDDHLSLAIGRRGQNVRLASQLTKWDIDILTEAEESERRQNEFNEKSEIFINALDVDEMIAQLLVSEGFLSIEDLDYVELSEISNIEGFDDDTAIEIQSRARNYLEEEKGKQDQKRKDLGVSDDIEKIDGITLNMLVVLGENKIKSLDDFADFSTDELYGWIDKTDLGSKKQKGLFSDFDISRETIEKMILDARIKLGWIEEKNSEETSLENEGGIIDIEDKKIDISEKILNARILK
jgi:N utilization substance protein A